MTFAQRRLTITFLLDPGTFDETGTNQLTVANVRASCRISNRGAATMGELNLAVWGLPKNVMAKLSTMGMTLNVVGRNQIKVAASNAGDTAPTTVFIGTIMSALADISSPPDVPFRITANSIGISSVLFQSPTSAAVADVATIASSLAQAMSLPFENWLPTYGVTSTVRNLYLYGPPKQQIFKLLGMAVPAIECNNGEGGILAIWPRTGARRGDTPVATISPQTGMIGYPTWTQFGLDVRTQWNPNVSFGVMVQIMSSLPNASQKIKVMMLDHALDSLLPGGRWESTLRGYLDNRTAQTVT